MIKEYKTIQDIAGQLVRVGQVDGVKYDELCEIELTNGEIRRGKVVELDGSDAFVQLFESSAGINPAYSKARFLGRWFELSVSGDILGRIFSGIGEPIDNSPRIIPEAVLNINGFPINPVARNCSSELIQTGVSAIDGLCPLSTGKKVPIFSASGFPHANLAAQIAQQAKLTSSDENIAIVFAAIGLVREEADFFITDFRRTGVISRTAMFVNLASDPVAERIATPRMALTAAEFLAYEKNMHVLVIMTDMANYADALREVDIAGQMDFSSRLRSDFAMMYERAGRKLNADGSVTVMPIFTIGKGENDKDNQLFNSARYIADGYIRLSKELHRKGYMPPVDVAASISGSGEKNISEEHADIMNQLLYCYANGKKIKNQLSVFGAGTLGESDLSYIKFADSVESKYINQGFDEERTIEQTLNLGLELLSFLKE